jgi:hypothetical protein
VKQLVSVTIPIYKETVTDTELLSLSQCLKVLHHHPIIFFAPQLLNTKFYESFCEGNVNFSVERFDNKYFQNVDGYNRLMLSAHFYERFLNYKFILVYQLDAYVFKDDLICWCKQNYDFIGAPHPPRKNQKGEMQFLKNYSKVLAYIGKIFKIRHKISNVGNGGFSLRKTRSFYLLLKLLKTKAAHSIQNEDGFFEYWGNLFYPFFRLPDDETALRFSIETSPKESLEKLNNILPFGCHAFEKYGFETWKPFMLNENETK